MAKRTKVTTIGEDGKPTFLGKTKVQCTRCGWCCTHLEIDVDGPVQNPVNRSFMAARGIVIQGKKMIIPSVCPQYRPGGSWQGTCRVRSCYENRPPCTGSRVAVGHRDNFYLPFGSDEGDGKTPPFMTGMASSLIVKYIYQQKRKK